MIITPKIDFVEGSFDTLNTEMVCVCSSKYNEVNLSFRSNGNKGMTVPMGNIKLYSKDLFVDAREVYDDACNLGNEIARRWNESENKI